MLKALLRLSSVLVLSLFLLKTVSASNTGVLQNIEQSDLPSLTAVLRRYSSEKPDVYTESWVLISPLGLRVTDIDTGSEIIKNFVSGKVWMLNRKHKVQHEIDVPAFRERFPGLVDYVTGPDTQSNILGSSPCVEWGKKLHGERVWRGHIVEDWNCTENSGVVVSEQMYSNRLGIVVRVQRPDTTIEELRNINEQELDLAVFQAEQHFKSISLDEFFGGSDRLSLFNE